MRPFHAGQPQLQEAAAATRTPATVVTVSEYAHVKTHRPAIKNMLTELAQPWEMAENATYSITLGDDVDAAESAGGDDQIVEESPVAVARVQEIGDDGGFQEKRSKLEGFFNFPPSIIGGDEDGFQIIEIPSGGANQENEINLNGKRILVKATSDMMKAAGYEAGSKITKG